jgi:hypothetical protein
MASCVCATLEAGSTTAQLEDWLRLQRCTNVSRVALLDSRDSNFIQDLDVSSWAMQPWIDGGFLVMLSSTPPETTFAERCEAVLPECNWIALLEAPHDVLQNMHSITVPASLSISHFAPTGDAIMPIEVPPRPFTVRATLRARMSVEETRSVLRPANRSQSTAQCADDSSSSSQ